MRRAGFDLYFVQGYLYNAFLWYLSYFHFIEKYCCKIRLKYYVKKMNISPHITHQIKLWSKLVSGYLLWCSDSAKCGDTT